MKTKQIRCKLCNSPLVGYLLQSSVYKFACGARECVDDRKSLGIRPMACKIISELGGCPKELDFSKVKAKNPQLKIHFPKMK